MPIIRTNSKTPNIKNLASVRARSGGAFVFHGRCRRMDEERRTGFGSEKNKNKKN